MMAQQEISSRSEPNALGAQTAELACSVDKSLPSRLKPLARLLARAAAAEFMAGKPSSPEETSHV